MDSYYSMMKSTFYLSIIISLMSCNPVPVYTLEQEPAYAYQPDTQWHAADQTLTVCSYNIEYALAVDQAIQDLKDIPFDILILQEMDEKGTEKIAEHFQFHSIYYPISIERAEGKLYGCSVLSKHPIGHHEKIILPHKQPLNFRKRSATYAETTIRERTIGIYSIHLETFIMQRDHRMDQLLYVLKDAEKRTHLDGLIFGGDFNSLFIHDMQEMIDLCHAFGYEHATAAVLKSPTSDDYRKVTALDHIFIKHLESHEAGVQLNASASDHFPIWCTLKI